MLHICSVCIPASTAPNFSSSRVWKQGRDTHMYIARWDAWFSPRARHLAVLYAVPGKAAWLDGCVWQVQGFRCVPHIKVAASLCQVAHLFKQVVDNALGATAIACARADASVMFRAGQFLAQCMWPVGKALHPILFWCVEAERSVRIEAAKCCFVGFDRLLAHLVRIDRRQAHLAHPDLILCFPRHKRVLERAQVHGDHRKVGHAFARCLGCPDGGSWVVWARRLHGAPRG